MANKKAVFHLYRYQLLPVNRYFTPELFGFQSLDELIEKKNIVFSECLQGISHLHSPRTEVNLKKIAHDGDFFVFKLNVNRSVHIETKNFQKTHHDNWPSIIIVVWNHPEEQLFFIQDRPAAFRDTRAVSKLLFKTINPILAQRQLVAEWGALLEKRAFWDLVKLHKDRLREVDFEIITPNMAWISRALNNDLKNIAKSTNSTKIHLKLCSDTSSVLRIDEAEPLLHPLVDYVGEGGGTISIKAVGIKKKQYTVTQNRSIEVDESLLEKAAKEFIDFLKNRLHD